jgi:hypothetical protein
MKRFDEFSIWLWIARRLPKKLRYAVTINSFAVATTGKFSNIATPEITYDQVMDGAFGKRVFK